jgi:hypothetical protein
MLYVYKQQAIIFSMKIFFLTVFIFFSFSSYSQKGFLSNIDSLPESRIDIPLKINLKPVYVIAEKNVDTVFTSPNYPNAWVQSDCTTRYKYRFRRSHLQMTMNGTTLNLGFTGYYQIIGSTRACAGNTVLSPWTPSCRCGFDEPERKVKIGFISTFSLLPNHTLLTRITRNEPKAQDKCEVCFWGQDVTNSVMNGIKAELDLSKKAMEDSFGKFNLRPYMQRAWNMLGEVHYLPGVGYFSLNPKSLRMNQINAKNDLLNINIGLTATPRVSFAKTETIPSLIPDLETTANPGGFNVFLEAALQYDSLSKIMNGMMRDKKFDVSEGLFKKTIVIKETAVSGDEAGNLRIMVNFTGSFNGTVFLTGKPGYNEEKKSIEVQDLDYDLQSKNLFLKTAKWLFNKRIIGEIKKYSSIELTQYYQQAGSSLNEWLNKEWMPGIKGSGMVQELNLISVQALPQHLLIRSNCQGKLSVEVTQINIGL